MSAGGPDQILSSSDVVQRRNDKMTKITEIKWKMERRTKTETANTKTHHKFWCNFCIFACVVRKRCALPCFFFFTSFCVIKSILSWHWHFELFTVSARHPSISTSILQHSPFAWHFRFYIFATAPPFPWMEINVTQCKIACNAIIVI